MSSSGEVTSRSTSEAAKNFFSKTHIIYLFNFIQNLVLAVVVTAVYTSIMINNGQSPQVSDIPLNLTTMTNMTYQQVVSTINSQIFQLQGNDPIIVEPDGIKVGYSLADLRKFLDDIGPIDVSYRLEAFDCDDFAYVLLGKEREWFGKNSPQSLGGSTFAWISGDLRLYNETEQYGHAMNLFIDNEKKVWLIEPQNYKIYPVSQLSEESIIDFILM